jgi:HSP20 family protein
MLRTLVNVNPVNELRNVEQFFDTLFGSPSRPVAGVSTLPVDITERDGNLLIKAAVPGINPEALEITVENNVLTINGETRQENQSENDKVYLREVSYGAFKRSIRLPEKLDLDQIGAEFEHGVVTVTIPTKPEAKPQTLRVPVRVADRTQTITPPTEAPETQNNN